MWSCVILSSSSFTSHHFNKIFLRRLSFFHHVIILEHNSGTYLCFFQYEMCVTLLRKRCIFVVSILILFLMCQLIRKDDWQVELNDTCCQSVNQKTKLRSQVKVNCFSRSLMDRNKRECKTCSHRYDRKEYLTAFKLT